MSAASRTAPERKTRWRRIKTVLAICAVTTLVATGGFAGWVVSLGPLPLDKAQQVSTTVVDRNGKLLRAYAMADGRWRLPVGHDEVDPRFLVMLKAYEDKTSDQVVVATVPSLQGRTVEDYANRLFRAWKLGQAKTDNGALLLVAPNERKVRIEVGYGLEGALTDALSKVIITTAITPRFKTGDYAGGINAGVDAVLSILAGDAEEWQRKAQVRSDEADPGQVVIFIVLFFVVLFVVYRMNRGQRGGRGGFIILPGPSSGGWSGGARCSTKRLPS